MPLKTKDQLKRLLQGALQVQLSPPQQQRTRPLVETKDLSVTLGPGHSTALAMASLTLITLIPTSAPICAMDLQIWTTRPGRLLPMTHGMTLHLGMKAVMEITVTMTVTEGSML